MGYFGGANILMEYVLSNAAVARTFTEYLSHAFGVDDPKSWRVQVDGLAQGYNALDFPAVALIILITLCLCHRYASFPFVTYGRSSFPALVLLLLLLLQLFSSYPFSR